jgi:hypothetical protein
MRSLYYKNAGSMSIFFVWGSTFREVHYDSLLIRYAILSYCHPLRCWSNASIQGLVEVVCSTLSYAEIATLLFA